VGSGEGLGGGSLEDLLGVVLDAVLFLDDLVGLEAGLVRFLWVVEPGF